GLVVSGAVSVDENSTSTYTATATWDDGTSTPVTPIWSENSDYASISVAGELLTTSVTSNQLVTLTASYTFEGVTETATYSLMILADSGIAGIVYVCNGSFYNCNNDLPVYSTISEGYSVSEDGAEIRVGAGFYFEDLMFNESRAVTLSGGWNSDYSAVAEAQSEIGGSLTIGGGTVIVEGIVLGGTESLAGARPLQFGCWLPEYWTRWASLD
ncbi:MAG: hypothetical protein JXR80_07375, partial [Deltaproteobacteria bacterium]|nr:hypothetical protein [Deltaproteobacteria bacterium]